MKPWLRFFLAGVATVWLAATAHAQKLNATGVSASPTSALPGDTVTFTVSASNSDTATDFTGTANLSITLTNLTTGSTFTVSATTVSAVGGIISKGVADATTNQITAGTGSFSFTAAVPTTTTQAGSYRATVTITAVSAGSIVTPTFAVTTGVLTVTGKPDLQITGLTYSSGTSYVGGTIIPMSLNYVNNDLTPSGNGNHNVPFVPGVGFPAYFRIKVVLSTNATFGDSDDFQLTFHDVSSTINADGATHTLNWNQILPGNFAGSYYVLAKIDSLDTVDENDPAALTVNGDNIWGSNALTPTATLINILPSNFPSMTLVTHASGATTSANAYADNPSMSSDGRYIAYASDASNLVSGDTNAVRDIFLYDSQTLASRRINVSQQGAQGNAASNNPVISSNGRYVAYASDANNLILGDTNGFSDIFVVDTLTGLVSRVSVTSSGGQANNPSFKPAISSTGRYVVFESTATNLDSAYTLSAAGGVSHIYLVDRDVSNSGTFDTAGNISTKLVDVDVTTPASVIGNASAIQATISSDGTMIAFASKGTNLVSPATTASRQHVYVRARANVGTATSGIKAVDVVNGTAAEGNGDGQTPSLSSDGHYVAFASVATNLVAGDTNGVSDIFVYDTTQAVATPLVRRMSLTNAGAEGTDPTTAGQKLGSINPTISSTGRFVAFASLDSNLTAGDSNGQSQTNDSNTALDIFVRDRDSTASGTFDTVAATTQLVSVNTFGYQTNGLLGTPSTAANNIYPVMSADGRYVALPSDAENTGGLAYGATNQLALDSNSSRDIFLFDRRINTLPNPSVTPTVTITNPGNGGSALVNNAISVTASATTTVGVVASVQFFVDGTSIGTSTVFPYSATWTPTAVGTYTLSALVTDSFGNLGVSSNVTVTINAAPSVGIITPAASTNITVGTAQTITATAAASNPGATIASVQFFANGATLGTITTAPYTVSWTPGSTGTFSLTAVAIDSIGTQTTSPAVSVTVIAAGGGGGSGGGTPPTVSLNPTPPASTAVNAPVTLTATAQAGSGFTLTSVQYFANGIAVGSATAFPYAIVWTPTAVGTYAITAVATDNAGSTTTSAGATVVVSSTTAPAVAITSPATGSSVGVNTLTTITATASSLNGFIASVQFFVNGNSLGTDTAFPYSIAWTPTGTGTYTLTARATDNTGNFTDSTAAVVTVGSSTPPTVSLTSPITGSAYTVGTTVNLAATAADPDGTIAQVQFFVNGVVQGTDTSSPYGVTWAPGSTGTYTVTAQATDNSGNVTTSTAATVTIGANAPPTISLTSPSTGLSYGLGNQVLIAATASDSDGKIASVQFFANGVAVGSATAAPFNVSWRPTAAGTYSLTGVATDDVGNIATSTAVSVTVTSASAPTVTVTNPLSTQTYGVGSAVPFTVTTSGGNGPIAQVQFFINGAPLSTDTASPYAATWTPVASGTYSLLAVATDSAGVSSNSSSLSITITGNSAPTVSLSTPTAGASLIAGSAVSLVAAASDADGTVTGVRFLANGTIVGTGSSAPFTATWTPTAAGVYSVIAEATDNSGNVTSSTAVAVTVLANQAPTVSLSSPSSGFVLRTGASTGLVATASDPDGTVARVQFLANGNVVGAATAAPYTTTWTPSAAGTYSLVAQATDNTGNVTSSSAVSVTVLANQVPTVSLTSPINGGVVRAGSATTLSANASDADGAIASVQFFANGVSLGAAITTPSTNGGYRTQWTPNVEGIYTLTATATDNSGAAVSTTSTVLAVSAATGGDTVYTGALFGLGETGRFAVIDIAGKTAAFIGYSTIDAGRVYFYPSIPVNAARGFSLTDATGKVLIAGNVNDTAATITTLDGAATTQIGLITSSAGTSVAAGYYTGSLAGRPASQLAAIIGADGSIMFAATDGSLRTAGAGFVDGTGAFANIAALGGGTFTGIADPSTKFLSGNLTGPIAGGLIAAMESGVSFSDGFLRNLSSRGQVGTGTNVLVAGFVVGGTTPKQVLIRAIGPSLTQFGLTGALADPQLQLFGGTGGSTLVASNDNWGGAAALATASYSVGAFPLSSTSNDAVVLATLAPGNYTAQVSGANNSTGTALVELYDVDNPTPYSSQKVINISTRAVVGSGQSQLIAGFVISGNTAKKVLVRAVGPTLGGTPFNVPGVLADPVLRIIRNSDNYVVRENDNWETGNDVSLVTTAAAKSGAFALASGGKDAAILINLPPGSYSAIVTGTGTTTGIALVEVYEVP